MKNENRTPAYFDERDLSSDFLEYIADHGDIVWQRSSYGSKHKFGLFFYQESPASVKYNKESNYLKLSFVKDTQRNECFKLFYDVFEPAFAEQGLEVTLENNSALELLFTFWWK